MKFGKLAQIEDVDFSLPPDHPKTGPALANLPARTGAMAIYLGCTGWSMKDWVGTVYPAKTPAKGYLEAYGRQFNTIELNTTHYRIPTMETVDRWLNETPADFRFCPKVPQVISHSHDLGLQSDSLKAFIRVIGRMESRLGCCFIQLPPHFASGKAELLLSFLRAWPAELPLAVEFRHASWFAGEPGEANAMFDKMEELNGKHTVITDVAGRRDVLHMRLTGTLALIRFVGNGLHPTDYERADAWVQRLVSWAEQGLHELYFFPHQPDNVKAPQMAAYLLEKLQAAGLDRVRGPRIQPRNPQYRLFD